MKIRAALGLAIALTLSACGGGGSSGVAGPSPSAGSASASPSAAATTDPRETASTTTKPAKPIDPRKDGLDVGFGEFAITLEAEAIRPGPVTLVVQNGGKLIHGFEMKLEGEGGDHSGHGGGGDDEFKLEEPTFGPDDTIRIKANLPAGVYEIECYVANHDDLGMRTFLEVREDAPLVRPKAEEPGQVAISGFAFAPNLTRVAAGDTVEWTNQDPTEHTVSAHDGSFSSQPLASGKGFRVTFDAPGVFEYYCAIHPTMVGTVEVTG